MVCQIAQAAVEVRVVRVLQQRRGHIQTHFGNGFGEHLVHHVRRLACPLVGEFRRHDVLLLVAVVDQVGMVRFIGIERHHVLAEALGDHHGGVVLARLRAIDGIVFVGKNPIHLVVRQKRGGNLLAHVHLERHQIALIAVVVVHHGNLQVARVVEHVPTGQYVVPAEDRGQKDKAQNDKPGNQIAENALHVVDEELADHLHYLNPPFRLTGSGAGESDTPSRAWNSSRSSMSDKSSRAIS